MPRNYKSAKRVVVLAALVLGGCSDEVPLYEVTGTTMGTSYSVKAVGLPAVSDLLQRQIEAELAAVNQAMSTYLPDSELSRFNAARSTDWFTVSRELCELVADANALSETTDGAFDVTVGPLVNLWGFGPDGAPGKVPDQAQLSSVMQRVGYSRLYTDCTVPALRKERADLYVDLSAIAKGHGVDRIAQLLAVAGVPSYLVEIGGELRAKGTNSQGTPWAIAIETPRRSGREVQSIVELTDAAMATSGDYRNYFEYEGAYFSHTIDPRTGSPVTHKLAAVTVVADTAALADGMATALLVLGPKDGYALAERNNIAAYFLTREGDKVRAQASGQFTARVSMR